MKIVATSCLLLALLTACGQRGPLYLPDKNAAPAAAEGNEAAEETQPQPAEAENGKVR